MEAQLLTGFDASTSGKGSTNPEPLLLRIQTPAVLPNDIKANLSGCFVIAEAVGRLDKERADVRLVSLSCLSNEGKAIIDAPVIEVGAAKKITVIISEGKELEIREIEGESF